jgi:hypothetical protein
MTEKVVISQADLNILAGQLDDESMAQLRRATEIETQFGTPEDNSRRRNLSFIVSHIDIHDKNGAVVADSQTDPHDAAFQSEMGACRTEEERAVVLEKVRKYRNSH